MTAVREELERRLQRWRNTALPIAQTALAASLAWLVASHVADQQSPFFAPIAAVICLGVTLGQRVRRGLEMVAGVGIGVGIGDLLISVIGTGPWQIALLVVLAMSAATLLAGKSWWMAARPAPRMGRRSTAPREAAASAPRRWPDDSARIAGPGAPAT